MAVSAAGDIGSLRRLCSDPAAIAEFHVRAFGCSPSSLPDTWMLGGQAIEFRPASRFAQADGKVFATSFQHFAIVVRDMAAAMRQLESATGWKALSLARPERLPPASGGATAFKFCDPDGHPLELLQFADDAVPAAWRRMDGLFLGIDHTAITVANTKRSIAFYETLGWAVTGRHLNEGPEQARLDGLSDARVEVTALERPSACAPHIELLCYRQPVTADAPAADGTVMATSMIFRGAPPTILPDRDPDGHRLEWR